MLGDVAGIAAPALGADLRQHRRSGLLRPYRSRFSQFYTLNLRRQSPICDPGIVLGRRAHVSVTQQPGNM